MLTLPADIPVLPPHPDYVVKWAETRALCDEALNLDGYEFEMRIAGPDRRLRSAILDPKWEQNSFLHFEFEGSCDVLPFRSYALRVTFSDASKADECWAALKAAVECGIEYILKAPVPHGP